MVRSSLEEFIGKYPWFLNRDKGSVFTRSSIVNNRSVQRMYNDLFHVYESAHIGKRLYIWREQIKDYDYNIHFYANYNDLKEVCVYKNDTLIYHRQYPYSDKENEKVNEFKYTYTCEYLKTNYLTINSYKCNKCGEIYFSNNIPSTCNCGHSDYTKLKTYKCNECGEIYFNENIITDCTNNNHINSLSPVEIRECLECGTIHFTTDEITECSNCHSSFDNFTTTDTLYYNDRGVYIHENTENYNNDGEYTLEIQVKNEMSQPLVDAYITLSDNNHSYEGNTNEQGHIEFKVNSSEYDLRITHNNYYEYGQKITILSDTLITPTLTLQNNSSETIIQSEEEYNIPIPIIPTDKFYMTVETWDEYYMIKGYPENDYIIPHNSINVRSIYDHDNSLDELGKLNNIPRKKYKIVDETEYPFTEPPYNDRLLEDDYHYMMRMLEYNLRLWLTQKSDLNINGYNSREFIEHYNPVTLELWKLYGLESRLINREKYLLKVFDENKHPFNNDTGLVMCWYPEMWEHKDRFCDGSTSLGEYLFVNCSTLRPLKWENVDFTFNVLNMKGETVNGNYSYTLEKLVKVNGVSEGEWRKLDTYTSNSARLKYDSFGDVNYPITLRFKAYRNDGSCINENNPTIVNLNVRSYDDGDWYVDPLHYEYILNPSSYEGDGSQEHPFVDLQSALDKCDGSLDLIILMNSITLDKTLTVSNNTIILGYRDSDGKVPVITQKGIGKNSQGETYNIREFFKINGLKNTRLLLSDIILKYKKINSWVNINSWINSNDQLEDYLYVIIHGGGVKLFITFDQYEYYPFDFINVTVKLTDSKNKAISDNTVKVYYKDTLYNTYTTDNDGTFTFKYNIQEENIGNYFFKVANVSDVYFEAEYNKQIPVAKNPIRIVCEPNTFPLLESENTLEQINFFQKDNDNIWKTRPSDNPTINKTDNNGEVIDTDKWKIDFNKYIIYTTIDNNINSSIVDEWSIETTKPITELPVTQSNKKEYIKNFKFDKITGDITYDTVIIDSDTTMNDLNGILVDLKAVDGELISKSYSRDYNRRDEHTLLYSDAVALQGAVYSIEWDDETGVLKTEGIGDEWWMS